MKPPISTPVRRLDPNSARLQPRRGSSRAACRRRRRPTTAIARLKWQISRLCDMVQRFSTVLPPEQCFLSSSAAAFAVVSHVTICLPSRLSMASCSCQATCSTVQLLFLTADAIAEMPASAELPPPEAPLTPVEHLDASSSWRQRRAVHCESEASIVLRMLDLNTRAFEGDDLAGGCSASGQTQVRQLKKWNRGCGGAAAGNRPRPHRQLKYRLTRRSQQQQRQQQQCVMLGESRPWLPVSLQPDAAAAGGTSVGTTWDLAPSSDFTYTSSLKQEPLTADDHQRCDATTAAGNTCQLTGRPKTQDSAFFTCSSNLTVPPPPPPPPLPPHHAQQAAGSCVSCPDADADSASRDNSPSSRRTLRRRCAAMTERLRSALVSAEVIPCRIRELLSEAVDLVASGAPGIHQDCRVSVDTLNCVDLGDAAGTWDLARDTQLQASPVATTCSMGDCSRGVPVQAVQQQQQQQQQQSLEWDPASQQIAGSRPHHIRRQRQMFKLVRRRRKTNTSD